MNDREARGRSARQGAAAGASLPRAPEPELVCALMACICRMLSLVLARLAVAFPSTHRGLMRPVPMAVLLVWAGRLCQLGL